MPENDQTSQTGDVLFEEFVEQVKQALGHLYDFAYLQQHPLARIYDGDDDLSTKTAGRQLRYELIKAIESLEPSADAHFRAPVVRLHNILHLYYIEDLSIQITAAELGLSERQAYRDLRRGQERVAAILWDRRLPSATQPTDFSLETEVARLKLNIGSVNIGDVFRKAQRAVKKIAQEERVTIEVEGVTRPLTLSTDAALAHQIIVNLLSSAIQQACPGRLHVLFATAQATVKLILSYTPKEAVDPAASFSAVTRLAQRLRWQVTYDDTPAQAVQVSLHMTSENATVFVIDDNEGWVELLGRFLKGFNYLLVSASDNQDCVQQAGELRPSYIILDVMMPERDGWEVLQRLRMQPDTAQTPIIMCTVLDDAQLAYSLGATAFISKPASREKILEALKQVSMI